MILFLIFSYVTDKGDWEKCEKTPNIMLIFFSLMLYCLVYLLLGLIVEAVLYITFRITFNNYPQIENIVWFISSLPIIIFAMRRSRYFVDYVHPFSAPAMMNADSMQRSLEYFTEMIQQENEKRASSTEIINMTAAEKSIAQRPWMCKIGLKLYFGIDNSRCNLEVNLDNLTKAEICDLIKQGYLYDEIMILYKLAHLPYTTYCRLNINCLNFDIIDRVSIHLHRAFHPLEKDKYVNLNGFCPYLEKDDRIERGIAFVNRLRSKNYHTK